MKASLKWTEGMAFQAVSDGHAVTLDAKSPIGRGTGPTPKELLLMGIAGCTGMDVVALLKKYRQLPVELEVSAEANTTKGVHPAVFEKALVRFDVTGDVPAEKLLEAVHLSQTKYCGVTAMLVKAFPIEYVVYLNGEEVGRGEAGF